MIRIAVLSALISACSSVPIDGRVRMKIDDDTAHVEAPDGRLKVGDRVAIVEQRKRKHGYRYVEKATGEITGLLGNKYFVLSFPASAQVSEGDVLRKLQ